MVDEHNAAELILLLREPLTLPLNNTVQDDAR